MKSYIKLLIFIMMSLGTTQLIAQNTHIMMAQLDQGTSAAPNDQATPTNDDVISTDIRSKISQDPLLTGADILVATQGGVVTLSGTVSNQAQIDEALKVAEKVNGVTSVKSSINVTSAGTTPSAPGTTTH